MKTCVKIFMCAHGIQDFEESINAFISNKWVIDIKFLSDEILYAAITYREQ